MNRSKTVTMSVHLGGPIAAHGSQYTDAVTTTGPSVFTDPVYCILCGVGPFIDNIIYGPLIHHVHGALCSGYMHSLSLFSPLSITSRLCSVISMQIHVVRVANHRRYALVYSMSRSARANALQRCKARGSSDPRWLRNSFRIMAALNSMRTVGT